MTGVSCCGGCWTLRRHLRFDAASAERRRSGPRDRGAPGLSTVTRLGWRLRLWRGRLQRPRYQDDEWDPLEFGTHVLTTVSVADIPAPVHLFKCPHEERLGQLHELDKETRCRAWDEFATGLTDEDLARCEYHQADWQKVAALSVAVLARMQAGQRRGKALRVICRKYLLEDRDQLALCFLFHDPISWGFGAPELANGQHRVCALKMSRADLCVVER